MQHYEWESDLPATEEPPPAARPPKWQEVGVVVALAAYLLFGLVYAIADSASRAQMSGLMSVVAFFFQIIAWPFILVFHP